MTPNYTLSAADIFFSTSFYSEDWDNFTDEEKTAGLNQAVKAIQQNNGKSIQAVADNLALDETIYNFNDFIYVQALYMLKNLDRYRTTTGAFSIMQIAEGKDKEKQYSQTLPMSYLYPEALSEIGIILQGVRTGRA